MPKNTWLALACALISLLLTKAIFNSEIFSDLSEKTGLAAATKVAYFLVIFTLTVIAINSFTLHDRGAGKNSQSQKRNQVPYDPVADQLYPLVMQDPNWPFAKPSEDDRQAHHFQDRARAWEKKEEKRIRKMLAKDFKPMRNALLGSRREPVVEVSYEPPSRTETVEFNGVVPTRTVKYSGGTTTRYVSWEDGGSV